MSDSRVYGMFDGTTLANLQQMSFGTETVGVGSFSPSWTQEYGAYGADSYAGDLFATIQNTASGCNGAMPFSPEITMEGFAVLCYL